MKAGLAAGISLLLIALAFPLVAYIQNQRPSGVSMHRDDFTAIPYVLDADTQPGLQNALGQFTITPGSDPVGAIEAAMRGWADVPFSEVAFAPLTTSSAFTPGNDGMNLITFADTPTTRSLVGEAVAVTFLFSRFNGVLTDTDILFNPRLRFSTDPDLTSFDIQGTLAHELGHAIGLDHSGVVGSTMFATTTRGSSRIASLSTDDIAFARDIYPSSAAPGAFGEIRGAVDFSFGAPVEGAHVVAVDPQQSIVVGAISESNGSYRIGRVPPGRYTIYAEPIDGPADRFQLGPTRRSPDLFPSALLGGLENPQQIEVTAGASVAADLIVESGEPALNIQGGGAAPDGLLVQDTLLAVVQPGGVFEMELFGEGLDAEGIDESSISFLGANIEIIAGSLDVGSARFSDGSVFPLLSFQVNVAPGVPAGLATAVVSAANEVVMFSGGVAILDPIPAPQVTAGGVTNAASFLAGPVAPGEIISIFGTNLGPQEAVLGELDEDGRVVTLLSGVSVTFNGLAAPIFFAGSGQLNVQVPIELAGAPAALMFVQRGQALSDPVPMDIEDTRPGLFTLPLSAAAVVVNQDGGINANTNPAARGTVVSLFGTGQGLTNPPLSSGEPAGSGNELSLVNAPVTVTIGGQPADVTFAGMAPGFAGLLQVNVVIPPGSTTGPEVPLELTIGGVPTGQGATIAID